MGSVNVCGQITASGFSDLSLLKNVMHMKIDAVCNFTSEDFLDLLIDVSFDCLTPSWIYADLSIIIKLLCQLAWWLYNYCVSVT